MKGGLVVKRRLLLMRHGSAEGYSLTGCDHDRKLTPTGRAEVEDVSRQLTPLESWAPKLILCSSALRTTETGQVLKNHLPFAAELELKSSFYNGSVQDLIGQLELTDPACTNLWVVGHNPALSKLAGLLCSQPVFLFPANATLLEQEAGSWPEALKEDSWQLHATLLPCS